MKRFKNMNDNEFRNAMIKAKKKSFTPFSNFFSALTGIDVWFEGRIVPRHELWFGGFRNAYAIIHGDTKYEVKIRPVPGDIIMELETTNI